MTKKSFIKLLGLLLVVGLLFAAAPVGQAQAATTTVACTGTGDSALLQAAITGATDGDTISVTGTCVLDSNITVSKAVTLDGNSKAAKIQVSGTGYRITMTTAGATLKGFEIEKTDKTDGQNIIWINASNITIENNKVHGQFVIGDGEVARAIVISGGNSGLLITGNEFYGLRQPAYISGVTTGTISNNYTHGTKGWVVEQGDMTFTGNTWGAGTDANVFDIAILGTVGSEYYTNIPAMSAANNNAFIEDQRGSVKLLTPVYVNASAPACASDCGTARAPYNKIQDGIDRVIPGGTVNVAAGTYEEGLMIDKALTVKSAEGATTTIISKNVIYVVIIRASNVTFDGFTVMSPGFDSPGADLAGIMIGYYGDNALANIVVKNNIVTQIGAPGRIVSSSDWPSTGICINGVVNGLEIAHNTISDIHQTVNDSGVPWGPVAIGYYGFDPTPLSQNVNIHDNTIFNISATKGEGTSPISLGIAAGWGSGNATIANNEIHHVDGRAIQAGSSNNGSLQITGNILYQNSVGVYLNNAGLGTLRSNTLLASNGIAVQNMKTSPLDAINNWWGSVAGPAAGQLVGDVSYVPWCGDEICSFLVYPMVGTDLQASIDATPVGGTLYVPDLGADPDYTGTYTVGGKTIILGDGVVIQANSPCFTVTDSYTTVTTESIGSAKCVFSNPLGSDLGGIEVDAGLKNIVIEGIYFEADAAAGAGDIFSAIYFDGPIEDVLINDNYFFSTGTGVDPEGYQLMLGIFFAEHPTGYVEIKGNLFDMQKIIGCAVEIGEYGTSTIDAQFNSFGSMAGHPASVPGVRVCEHVDYGDFTHADVYLESSATPWLNQEVVGQPFTLTVKANLTKVTGAKFTLKYDPVLVDLDAASLNNLSGFSAAGLNLFEVDETLGLITFNANTSPAITGTAYPLFSASFTASAVGGALFEVNASTDEFAMFPSYGASSNVYAYELLPVTVDLIELPTVVSNFSDSYYLVEEARAFTITVTNYDTAYSAPELRLTLPAGLTLTYGGTDYTSTLVIDLADLALTKLSLWTCPQNSPSRTHPQPQRLARSLWTRWSLKKS